MVEEVNRIDDSPESQPVEPDGIDGEEPEGDVNASSDTESMKDMLAQKDEELTRADARITELESVLKEKDGEITTLKQSVSGLEESLSVTRGSLAEAVASYREAIVRANPDIVEELISGDNVASLNESLEKARDIVDRVKQGLEAEIVTSRVPAGAPERRSPDLSDLSPRDKIKYAIGGKG